MIERYVCVNDPNKIIASEHTCKLLSIREEITECSLCNGPIKRLFDVIPNKRREINKKDPGRKFDKKTSKKLYGLEINRIYKKGSFYWIDYVSMQGDNKQESLHMTKITEVNDYLEQLKKNKKEKPVTKKIEKKANNNKDIDSIILNLKEEVKKLEIEKNNINAKLDALKNCINVLG